MRTESTFSFGDMLDDEDALEVEPDGAVLLLVDLSSVPVISTLWPTCGESFESSDSSL